jgi:hypothetical protein
MTQIIILNRRNLLKEFHSAFILEYSERELVEWLREVWGRRAGASQMK